MTPYSVASRPKGALRAVSLINRLPGTDVLEVGVGTGLALPHYNSDKRVTGIDLSKEMLRKARERTREGALTNVQALHEMDAEATSFDDHSFDIAVGMFVASVVPNPRRLLAEMRRLVRPGGDILLVNHFAAAKGPRWWLERAMAPASRALGWHPDFAMDAIFSAEDLNADRGGLSRLRDFYPGSPAGLALPRGSRRSICADTTKA